MRHRALNGEVPPRFMVASSAISSVDARAARLTFSGDRRCQKWFSIMI
jgi:hypothetical protein